MLMENEIKNNIFVFTRDLLRDYYWVCKPSTISEKSLKSAMEQRYASLKKNSKIFTSEWYRLNSNEDNIVFRIVVDGRKDEFGRLIKRYEGSIVHTITEESLTQIERSLLEKQYETNNYNYGFPNQTTSVESEICQIDMTNEQVVIKSHLLRKYLEEHSYDELLSVLKIEDNDLEQKPKTL